MLLMSPSSQRVWIEIKKTWFFRKNWGCRPLHRGCGLKFSIKIRQKKLLNVALFTEGVDWNLIGLSLLFLLLCRPLHRGCGLKSSIVSLIATLFMVALFTEGVDWNLKTEKNFFWSLRRPLHRGCGLKFLNLLMAVFLKNRRPLHRGCGLKLRVLRNCFYLCKVALFTEGVDWNSLILCILLYQTWSPSSQRVWIEICICYFTWYNLCSRPLHRGCGLKSFRNKNHLLTN